MLPTRLAQRPPLFVFADDWGRHPSSCQYLIGQLLDRYEVSWFNTIGTRPPRLTWSTVKRGLEKLCHWTRHAATDSGLPAPRVFNPRMWPWLRTSFDRRLNRWLLNRHIKPLALAAPTLPVAVTTLPIVADLMGVLPVQRWIYYCVDDFSEWPGLDGEAMRRLEEVVVRRADLIIAAGENLQGRLARLGRESKLLTHGVDLDFWTRPGVGDIPGIAGLEQPLVVFWGLVDPRMDLAFVRSLATALPRGTIVLAGPTENPDPALLTLPRVVGLGKLPLNVLPSLAQAAAVLIMPYADLPVTRAMQPLKLKEYLATGKPAVVRDLPATRPWADCADLVDNPEAFAQAVLRRLQTGLPAEQSAARTRLADESWAEKAHLFEQWALVEENQNHAVACS